MRMRRKIMDVMMDDEALAMGIPQLSNDTRKTGKSRLESSRQETSTTDT
jgi:hypothetical protein